MLKLVLESVKPIYQFKNASHNCMKITKLYQEQIFHCLSFCQMLLNNWFQKGELSMLRAGLSLFVQLMAGLSLFLLLFSRYFGDFS